MVRKKLLKSDSMYDLPKLFRLRLVCKDLKEKIDGKFLEIVGMLVQNYLPLKKLGFKNAHQALKFVKTYELPIANMEGLKVNYQDAIDAYQKKIILVNAPHHTFTLRKIIVWVLTLGTVLMSSW